MYISMQKAIRLYIYIIVLLKIEFNVGIRCYSCSGIIGSKQHPDHPCLNPAKNVGDGNVYEIDCLNKKLCWKGITGGLLTRGCAQKRCAIIPDINMGSLISQTCCSNDLCNRTSSIILSKWIVYSLMFFSLYILK